MWAPGECATAHDVGFATSALVLLILAEKWYIMVHNIPRERHDTVRLPKRGSWRQGQSLVELALVLPVVLFLILGIMDFGRVFNAYIVITNASREGALFGTFHPPDTTEAAEAIKDRVMREATGSGITLDRTRIQVFSSGTAAGAPVTVTVAYPFSAVTPEVSALFGGTSLMLRAQTVMVIRE